MAITGVFFDLGGTLFSYRNVSRATMPLLYEVAERLGFAPDSEQIKRAYAEAGRIVAANYASKSYYAHRDYFLDNLRQFATELGGECPQTVAEWYLEAHRVAIINCLVLKEDCIETLAHLRDAGLYLSIVSNIDDDMLKPLLERENLAQYFDHCTSSEAAQSCKPHRGFFDYALKLSGLQAHSVMFVGDSPEHDIVGANSVGFATALIADGGMPPPLATGRETVAADHTLAQLSDLKSLLAP